MELLTNPTVAAFFGAFFAFLLVAATDRRRRKRIKKLLTYLVSDNIDQARSKIAAVKTDILLLREDNKITCGSYMPFPTQSIKDYQHEILDMLNANEKQALDALVFWMEAIDVQITAATNKAVEIKKCIRYGDTNEEETILSNEFIDSLEEAEKNLDYFIALATYYKNGEPHKILEFQHEVGNNPIT